MSALLEVAGLTVSYGRVAALRDASFRLERGQIVTIIGPNGAGKTTLLKAVMGLLACTGRVAFEGQPVEALEVEARVERGLLLVSETRDLFAQMAVRDNLLLGAYRHRGRGGSDLDQVYGLFPRLHERRDQLAGTLSGGERQMLAVARALMGRPKLLMLDEPSLGLAPLIAAEIFRIVAGLRSTGVGILLVEQNARAALAVADYGYVLETGEVVRQDTTQALLEDPTVAEIYLGGVTTDIIPRLAYRDPQV